MTAKYWIKLYHEMLHDPKMGRMSDHLYRRCIELFLLAGERDNGGLLPSVEDMAWILRADPDDLANDIHALAAADIVNWTEDGWVVTHFAERQDADTDAERMRQLRKRKRHAEYSGNERVTDSYERVTLRNIDKNREEEEEESESQSAAAPIQKLPEPQGGKKAPPKKSIGTDRDAERIFQDVTGLVTFPAASRGQDIDRILAIAARYADKTTEFLKPFYSEWSARGYSKSNTSWLDWAIGGEIPKNRKEKPRSEVFIDV